MKVSSECIPCLLRQVLRTARMASVGDEWLERKVLNEVMAHLIESSRNLTPAELSHECHRFAGKILGMNDSYQQERKETLQAMLALESKLRDLIQKESEADKLMVAAKLAASANVFDSILEPSRNIELIFQKALSSDFALSSYKDFQEDLSKAKSILYILNSSGEFVADRLFLEHFPPEKEISLVVRKMPIVTDAIQEDVETVNQKKYIVLDLGVDTRGVPLEQSSVEFREKFQKADLVIAKGQANYETLHTSGKECFYLLRTKCEVVARQLGVKLNDLVFLKE